MQEWSGGGDLDTEQASFQENVPDDVVEHCSTVDQCPQLKLSSNTLQDTEHCNARHQSQQ